MGAWGSRGRGGLVAHSTASCGAPGPWGHLQLQGQALSDPGSDILPFTAPRVSSVDLLTEPLLWNAH